MLTNSIGSWYVLVSSSFNQYIMRGYSKYC